MAWNGSCGYSKQPKKVPCKAMGGVSLFHGIIALVAIVVIGAVAYLFVSNDTKPMVEKKQPKAEKKAIEVVEPETAEKVVEAKVEPKNVVPPKPRGPNLRDPKLSEEKRFDLYEKTLKEKEIPPETTNRLFRTGVEQVMAGLFSTEVGDMPPPLPPISDFDFVHLKEILDIDNPVLKGDSDGGAEAKEIVAYAKQEFKKYIEKGGEPDDFLQFYHDELTQAYMKREAAYKQVLTVLKEEPESALEYLSLVNATLRERGIKEVQVAPRTLARYGIRLQGN